MHPQKSVISDGKNAPPKGKKNMKHNNIGMINATLLLDFPSLSTSVGLLDICELIH